MSDTNNPTNVLIGLVIYFTVLIFIVSLFVSVGADYDVLNNVEYEGGDIGLAEKNIRGFCDYPQFRSGFNSNRCSKLMDDLLVYDNATCTNISGCSWEQDNYLFFWGTGTYACKGYINLSYYHYEPVTYTALGSGDVIYGICEASDLDEEKELCLDFGCTWNEVNNGNEEELNTDLGSIEKIKLAIGFVTGFNANLGLNAFATILISLIIFYIPLVWLGVTIYQLLPFTG